MVQKIGARQKAMRQANDAAMRKIDIVQYAKEHPELAAALTVF